MATITSNGTGGGDFSAGSTWVGGIAPGNGDAFVIAAGDAVNFDLDTSGFAAGFAASTIHGTLNAKRNAGAHYLKMNGSLTIATTGTLDASDGSGGAYLNTATFTILLNGNFSITVSGSGAVNLICGEPTMKYVKLSGAASIGATTLDVDSDVTGEALWAAGALIRVDDINQAAESEERVISGSPTATTIDITVGLTAAKAAGAYVILISRNVKILGAGTASGTAVSGGTGGVIGAEIRSIAVGVNAATSAVIGGSLSTITTAIQTCDTPTVNAVISGITTAISGGRAAWLAGLISGFTIGVSQGAGHILTEGAIITGGVNGFSSSAGALIMGEIANCASGCTSGGGYTWRGARMSNNTRDLINISNGQAFNTLFGSSTEFSNYNAALRTLIDYVESFDHDQTAGAFRSWTRGGITSSNTGTVYPGRPRSYNAVCESASYPAFFQRQVLVPAGGSVYARCYARKDASMSYLPRVWVFSAEQEPLVSGTPDAEVTMDVADAVDTWEVLEATVTNATDAAKLYTVRMLAKNASGNVYFDPEITVSAGVSRARLVNAA